MALISNGVCPMLRVDLKRARPGMVLSLPIPNPQAPSRTLLKAGYPLESAMIEKLRDIGIRFVWVRCPALEFLNKFIDREGAEARSEVIAKIAGIFESLQSDASAKLPYDTYTASIESLVQSLVTNPSSAVFLGDLIDGPSDLLRHSSAVTYLTLLMGLKLEGYLVRERRHVNPMRAKEVVNLGVGAMLHDIGLVMMDEDRKEEYERTGDDADPRFREHCAIGYQAVRGHIDPSAATVVLHHHQRFDGKGFTGPGFPTLEGRRIHVFSRVVSVADAFDRMRQPRKLPPQSTAFVLHHMVGPSLCDHHDPTVLNALLEVVPPFPPGSIVKLSDGRFAVVVDHLPQTPCLPPVQVLHDAEHLDPDNLTTGETLHLAASEGLTIVEHEGHDVRDCRFGRPEMISAMAA